MLNHTQLLSDDQGLYHYIQESSHTSLKTYILYYNPKDAALRQLTDLYDNKLWFIYNQMRHKTPKDYL